MSGMSLPFYLWALYAIMKGFNVTKSSSASKRSRMYRNMYSEIFYLMKVVDWEVICDDITDGKKI